MITKSMVPRVMRREKIKEIADPNKMMAENVVGQPLISIITPTYNPNMQYFEEAVNSVFKQTYQNWEWCICDDGSKDSAFLERLNNLKKSQKIKVYISRKNSGICAATNHAVSMATGSIITFLDHDDELTIDALAEVVYAFNSRDADVVYSDETLKRMDNGLLSVHAKPNYSPHYLLATNYICHLLAVKKELFNAVGGIREGFDGSQDHDLVLRLTGATTKIIHIQKSLYLWRIYPGTFSRTETLNKAIDSGIKAIKEELLRCGFEADVFSIRGESHYDTKIKLKEEFLVSIIIPTPVDSSSIIECVSKILNVTSYKNYKINITSNSKEAIRKKILGVFSGKSDYFNFLENYELPFNFSKSLNKAIKQTDGKYIVLLHDDVMIHTADWLERMIGFAQDPIVGAVTGKILNTSNVITEMGGILGLRGIASSMFRGMPADALGDFARAELTQNTTVTHSSLMMFDIDKYFEISGFDEEYTAYNFDLDFSLRLRINGYFNVILPACRATHFQNGTRTFNYGSSEKISILSKDEELFLQKHRHLIAKGDPYYNPLFPLKSDYLSTPQAPSAPVLIENRPEVRQLPRHVASQRIYDSKDKPSNNAKSYVPAPRNIAPSTNMLISFIVPWYEQTPVIIPSLLAQTYKNIEIILYHDGPAPKPVTKYIEALNDDRISFYTTPKRYGDWGHTPRNMAIKKLSDKSMATVVTGIDNYYLPSFTRELSDPLYRDAGLIATYCDMIHNGVDWNTVKTRLQYACIDCGCFMVRSTLLHDFGWGNRVDWEDWIFIEKVLNKYGAGKIRKIDRMLYVHN